MSLKIVSRSSGLPVAIVEISGSIELEPAEINALLRKLKTYGIAAQTAIKFGSLDPVRADHVQCGRLSEDIAERELASTVFAASLGVARHSSTHTLGPRAVTAPTSGAKGFRIDPPDEHKE